MIISTLLAAVAVFAYGMPVDRAGRAARFGAFFECAAGLGTPVAVTAGLLIGLGFSPLAASGLSLIANTAPVAFGAPGTPVIMLTKVHGYDLMEVTAMIGRQLPFFSLLVPFWMIWAFAGRKAMWEIWPAILVTGLSFAIPQYLVSNLIGPELVDIIAAIVSMLSLVLFLRMWQPRKVWTSPSLKGHETDGGEAKPATAVAQHSRADLMRAWTPWINLTVFVFIWGLPPVKAFFNGLFAPSFPVAGLHKLIEKVPPVVPVPHKEAAVCRLNLLSSTGTGILLGAIVGALVMNDRPPEIAHHFLRTAWLVRKSLLTIVLMLAPFTLTRGWIGAANNSGGVMGKMIDPQSIVVASTATRWFNHEGGILRYVFFHWIALACLVGLFVTLQAFAWPFTLMAVH